MKLKNIFFILALLSIVGWGPLVFFNDNNITPASDSRWINRETDIIHSEATNLDPNVLKLSLKAYLNARHKGLDNKEMLTIVDYSKPSTERRLWVVNLRTNKVLFNTWVAHGKNSGELNSTSFSNQARSLKSSLGVFVTENTYDGHNGYSLRVQGLEHGFNDNAYSREVVFHGANYVSPTVAKELGRLGRSWGCFAVGRSVVTPLINTIKDQTVVVAYYPDSHWLKTSTYLNSKQI